MNTIDNRARRAEKVGSPTTNGPTGTSNDTLQGKWNQATEIASDSGQFFETISLRADTPVTGWVKQRTPELVVRCVQGKTELAVKVGMAVQVDSALGSVVQIGLDEEAPAAYVASISSAGEELIVKGPRKLIDAMTKSAKMSVSFVPFNAGRAETVFDLTGLTHAIEPLRERCRW